jgi:hypothetical protein
VTTVHAPAARALEPGASALAYAAAGWPVFPCKPGEKAPDTVHGFRDATTDPAVIRAWWERRPERNVAIATGPPGPDVLDIDVKPDGTGWPAFNRLKRAGYLAGARALVRTPSGGLHVYFAGTGQPCGRLPRHYLDFKAAGGYVVAPPSAVGGHPYELLDHRSGDGRFSWQAARRLLEPHRAPMPRCTAAGDITRLAAWVARQPEGNRNAALFWAACRTVESGCDPAGLVTAAMQAGLSEAEVRATISSARRVAV